MEGQVVAVPGARAGMTATSGCHQPQEDRSARQGGGWLRCCDRALCRLSTETTWSREHSRPTEVFDSGCVLRPSL